MTQSWSTDQKTLALSDEPFLGVREFLAHSLSGATTSLVKPVPGVPGRKEPMALLTERWQELGGGPKGQSPLSLGYSMTNCPSFPGTVPA